MAITSSFPCGCFWNQLIFSICNHQKENNTTRKKNQSKTQKGNWGFQILTDLRRKRSRSCKVRRVLTWISAAGEGVLRLSEREAMAHINARIVTANVNKAFALYPNECIFLFLLPSLQLLSMFACFFSFSAKRRNKTSVLDLGVLIQRSSLQSFLFCYWTIHVVCEKSVGFECWRGCLVYIVIMGKTLYSFLYSKKISLI